MPAHNVGKLSKFRKEDVEAWIRQGREGLSTPT